jgi:hypothetical protein
MPIFAIGLSMGQITIAIAAWAIGGLFCLILVIEHIRARPGPDNVRD